MFSRLRRSRRSHRDDRFHNGHLNACAIP
jgi:hypothetical protein